MKPNLRELAFILIIGSLQPIVELITNSQISTYYNGSAIFIAVIYVIYRILKSKKIILIEWGFRLDNIKKCLLPYFISAVIGCTAIYCYGWYFGNTPLPIGFWYVIILYPIWGIMQQFALQNFVARNLTNLVPSLPLRSLVTAILFACAHIPSIELVLLTFIVGFIFTYIYHYYSNLLLLGFAHGILGALVFHLVLNQNQWDILLKYFS